MKSSFKSTTIRSRAEAATLLRTLADALEKEGDVELALNGSEVEFSVPTEVECEVEIELDAFGENELEVEMKWLAPGASAAAAESKVVHDSDFTAADDAEAMHDADALEAESAAVAQAGEEPVLSATEDVDESETLLVAAAVGATSPAVYPHGGTGEEADEEADLASAAIRATTPAEYPHGSGAQA